jgi:7-carboxy-7-deazaguanine synthase
MNTLHLVEKFKSIQGESSFSGARCQFYRLAKCNLDCKWCDTPHKNDTEFDMTSAELAEDIRKCGTTLIEFTGGEPLLQFEGIFDSLSQLQIGPEKNTERIVLIETNGSIEIPIERVDRKLPIIFIMDIKAPSSEMFERMRWDNLFILREMDEVKFVLAEKDVDWFRSFYEKYRHRSKAKWIISPAFKKIKLEKLADLVKEANNDLMMQIQLHKYIWNPKEKGV